MKGRPADEHFAYVDNSAEFIIQAKMNRLSLVRKEKSSKVAFERVPAVKALSSLWIGHLPQRKGMKSEKKDIHFCMSLYCCSSKRKGRKT